MNRVDRFFSEDVSKFTESLEQVDADQAAEDTYQSEIYDRLKQHEAEITAACRSLAEDLSDDDKALTEAKERFRRTIYPWYSKSFFMERATDKPCGYPGDYVILEGIYDYAPRSTGLGRYLDRVFFSDELAVAVRNRKDLIREKLQDIVERAKDPIRVLNVASGSCREWYELLPAVASDNLTLICVDFDQKALDYSRTRMEARKSEAKIIYVNDNALRLAVRNNNRERYGTFDVVYSFGLYDYLPDKVLMRLLQSQWGVLNSGGKMIMTFKDRTKYDQTKHGWFCDWYFEQRDEQDVIDLLENAGFDISGLNIVREPSDTVIFLELIKD